MKNTITTDPLITRRETRRLLGDIAKGTLQKWEKDGRMPPPIRLSTRVIGWRRSTIEALLQSGSL